MKVTEIFYSLQGEGHFAGHPAVFVRFSGCNMACSFCDTDHSSFTEMTEEDILNSVSRFPARHVVLTGGEPTLQISASLLVLLKQHGFFIQIETNGTIPVSRDILSQIDWITCSPKTDKPIIGRINELKVVYEGQDISQFETAEYSQAEHRLQPCDTGNPGRNRELTALAVDYIKAHPLWRLSLQTHKLISIP